MSTSSIYVVEIGNYDYDSGHPDHTYFSSEDLALEWAKSYVEDENSRNKDKPWYNPYVPHDVGLWVRGYDRVTVYEASVDEPFVTFDERMKRLHG